MALLPYDQARLLSHCGVPESYFDSLTTDQFFDLLPVTEVEGDCLKYARIRNVDKPASIAFLSSGGAMSPFPAEYGASNDLSLKRIATQVQVSGDVSTIISAIHRVARDQALALAALLRERVSQQLWAENPGPNSPTGMATFAGQNPAGTITPDAGPDTALTLPDMERLLDFVSPWSPASPLYYVMHTKTYRQALRLAREAGSCMDYAENAALGGRVPHFDGIPMVACDHIALTEVPSTNTSVYLVRVGRSDVDPRKIAGVSRLHPKGQTEVTVSPLQRVSATSDVFVQEVVWNIAFANFSAGSVARLERVLS